MVYNIVFKLSLSFITILINMFKKHSLKFFFIVCFLFASNTFLYAQITNQEDGRPDVPGSLLFDLGFNMLLNNEQDSMEMNFWGSKVVNINYLFELKINENFYFLPGFGVGLEKYRFDKQVSIATSFANPDTTVIVGLSEYYGDGPSYKRSKLAVNYFDVPLELRFYANPENKKSGLRIGIGGKIGILYSAHTKVNYEFDDHMNKIKQKKDFNLNRFRYGVSGRIGFGSFGLFGYYSLSELFEEGNGPTDANTINFGLTIIGF